MTTITNVEFLEAMFVDMPDDCSAILAGFVGDPCKPPQYAWARRPWTFGAPLHPCIHRDANTYVAVSSFRADDTGEYRRRKSQFARLAAVMVDDLGTKVAHGRLRLPLSALIETSPRNCQGYWLIYPSAGSDNGDIAARLVEALIAAGMTSDGTDPGMKGVTRYGRLPVGVNAKAKYVQQLGRPFRVRLVEWHPERRYTVEEIAASHGLDITARPVAQRALVSGEATARVASFDELMQLIAGAGLYRESHGVWHDIVCPWIHAHSDRAETGTAVREPSESNNWAGGFRCHHGHCTDRTIADVYRWARAFRRGVA